MKDLKELIDNIHNVVIDLEKEHHKILEEAEKLSTEFSLLNDNAEKLLITLKQYYQLIKGKE